MRSKLPRRRNKLTQMQVAMYILIMNKWLGGNKLIPVYDFMGERYISELGKWGYISYECSARLSKMYSDNPGLLYREKIHGRSGASFYGYKIRESAQPSNILSKELRDVYDIMAAKRKNNSLVIVPPPRTMQEKIAMEVQKAVQAERERIVKMLDWKNRTDGAEIHSGSQAIDWIEEKLATLSTQKTA